MHESATQPCHPTCSTQADSLRQNLAPGRAGDIRAAINGMPALLTGTQIIDGVSLRLHREELALRFSRRNRKRNSGCDPYIGASWNSCRGGDRPGSRRTFWKGGRLPLPDVVRGISTQAR